MHTRVYTSATKMDNESNRLKCSNCNIVICEVLAFIQNKLDVMDEQSLVQICESAFSTTDIKLAKSLLFESLSKRPTTRKREGRTLRDLEDIICLFKETNPEEIPIFVAKRLEKLPPVTFDHVDVTALLKKIVLLEKNIQDFQHQYATKREVNDQIKEYYKNTSLSRETNSIVQKGGRYKMSDSRPMALTTLCAGESFVDGRNVSVSCPSLSSVQHSPLPELSPAPADQPTASVNDFTLDECERTADNAKLLHTYRAPVSLSPRALASKTNDRCEQMDVINDKRSSFSEVTQKSGEWKVRNNNSNEEWTLVQKRRHRNRFISQRGSAITDDEPTSLMFRAADTKLPLFISNVHKTVSEQDIVNYLYEKTQERVTLVKIKMKQERNYNAYKLFVSKHKIDAFLDNKLWPSGVSFRRFVHYHMRRKNNEVDENIINNK